MRKERLHGRILRWLKSGFRVKAEGSAVGSAQDLTFAATSDLIDELNRRHDALIVLGMRFNSKEAYGITRFHHGHRYVCLGLLSNATAMINEIEMAQLKTDKNG